MASPQLTLEANLRSNSPEELQNHGTEHFADLDYRVEVARRMSNRLGADQALLFDDVAFAVPEEQRPKLHALPGYERALLPALLLAPGFEKGASVLVSAPPNPVERQSVLFFLAQLEQRLARVVPFQILFESDAGMIDLTKLSEHDYAKMCYLYAQSLNNEAKLHEYDQWHHLKIMGRRANEIIGDGRTLVIPFQMTEHHQSALSFLIDEGAVILPSSPCLDKATNNFLLREGGYSDIPHMLVVSSHGDILSDSKQLQDHKAKQPSPVPATEDNVRVFANAILTAVDRLAEEGKMAYIKLDSNGVSGLGNLAHNSGDYGVIYDVTNPRERRLKLLVDAIRSNYQKGLPETAVVEEFIHAGNLDGVKHDITVGGVMIGGTFFPMSSFPFAVNGNDEYVAGWMAENAKAVGESESHWKRLFESFAHMGKIMAKTGYADGILAGDALTGTDGNIYLHDFNFRRGGRSYLEGMIALWSGGLFEVQIEVDQFLPQGLSNEQRFDLYTDICRRIYQSGIPIFPFSTAFGYFGADHNVGKLDFTKFKLAVPMSHPLIAGKPRNEHLPAVRKHIENLINNYAQSR